MNPPTNRSNPPPNRSAQPSTINRSNSFDDFMDDDLLCDVDIDQIAASVVPTPQHSTETNRENLDNSLLFDDSDDEDFMQIDPDVVNIVEPQHSICSDGYRFKIRGINLATIKQLATCSLENKTRCKNFLVRGVIYNIPSKFLILIDLI